MKHISEKYKEFWEQNKYEYCYIAIDIHNTIFVPSYDKEETFQYYPMAKQCLKELTKNTKVKLILWSSCYPHKFMEYINKFSDDGIKFNFINENPYCFSSKYANFEKKFYFDIGIDDKFGFDATIDWEYFYPEIIKQNLK